MKTKIYIKLFAILLLIVNCVLPATSFAQAWQTYPYSPPASVLTFPNDDGYHPALSTSTEWWYINLHLIGKAPLHKQYDVMLVYFRFANMRIFNISESSGSFHSNVLQVFPVLTAQLNKWDLTYTVPLQINDYSKWTYPDDGVPYRYKFYAKEPTHNDLLDVTVTSNRAPLVVGGNGFIAIGDQGDSSFYYSYTNMKVEGSIRYNGVDDSITSGIAWIDRQYGPFNVGTNTNNKYEWFSLQVDKQNTVLGQPQTPSEFNIWQIFSDSSSIPYKPEWRTVSAIYPDDTQDTSSTFFFERTGYWHDVVNNKYYSSRWRFIEPEHGVNIDITPNIPNQVINVTLFKFWEGSTTLKGTVNNLPVNGVGFAELVADHNYGILLPSVPSGLTVTPNSNHYSLSWNAATAGTYPIGGYRIYRSPNNNGNWEYISTTTNLTYDDFSAVPDSSCFYTVTSFDNQTATSASDYATAVHASPLGIMDDFGNSNFLKIFPNPTTGKAIITLCGRKGLSAVGLGWTLEIYNVFGEKIYTINNFNQKLINEIDLSGSAGGIYFVKLFNEEKVYSNKIVIQ